MMFEKGFLVGPIPTFTITSFESNSMGDGCWGEAQTTMTTTTKKKGLPDARRMFMNYTLIYQGCANETLFYSPWTSG